MVRPLLGLVRLLLSQDREGLTILNVFSFCKTFSFHTLILHHGSVIEFLQFKTFFKMKTEPQWWSREPASYRQYEKSPPQREPPVGIKNKGSPCHVTHVFKTPPRRQYSN